MTASLPERGHSDGGGLWGQSKEGNTVRGGRALLWKHLEGVRSVSSGVQTVAVLRHLNRTAGCRWTRRY